MNQNLTKMKVLIIEDDVKIVELLKYFCTENNIECDIAHDGIEAEKLFKNEEYSLIITDLILFPRSGGIDFINTIRQSDHTIPIIAMTGFGIEVAQEAIEAGATDFILKPFNFIQIRRKIGRYIDICGIEKRFGTIDIENGFIIPA